MPHPDGNSIRKVDGAAEKPIETGLPCRLRLLCVGATEPAWSGLTLQLDAQGCTELNLKWVRAANEALGLLRESSFDCLLIHQAPHSGHADERYESLALLRAVRASGCDDAVVIVAADADDLLWSATCIEEGELLVTSKGLESAALIAVMQRAMHRVELMRENRRLLVTDRRRVSRERDEAEHLLSQQRQILSSLEFVAGPNAVDAAAGPRSDNRRPPEPSPRAVLPVEVNQYYQELLRTYVIMGSGSLGTEIAKLAELLCIAELNPREALEIHLERVEQLVRGLGNRSTRHVLARADLLALELMIHLGECYQRRARSKTDPGLAKADPGPSFGNSAFASRFARRGVA